MNKSQKVFKRDLSVAIKIGRGKGILYLKANDFSKVRPKDVLCFVIYLHFSQTPGSGDTTNRQYDRFVVGFIDSRIACKIDFAPIRRVISKVVDWGKKRAYPIVSQKT